MIGMAVVAFLVATAVLPISTAIGLFALMMLSMFGFIYLGRPKRKADPER